MIMPQRLSVRMPVRAPPCSCVCVLKGDGCIKMGFFTLNGAREVKAFHSEKQRRAGGGDMASGNLDSPVVYL